MMMPAQSAHAEPADKARVVTQAVVKAAQILDISGGTLAKVIGVSPATVSRMRNGAYMLEPTQKEFELGLYFVRMFRSLDSLTSSNDGFSRSWLRSGNRDLGERPIDLIQTIKGLLEVCDYIDAHRAPI
jgi:uncharacterized protein (DUF2384 family)